MALTYDSNWLQPLTYLAGPFWGKNRIASWLAAYLRQVDKIEQSGFDILERYTIEGADDARLAVLGRVVGQSNHGWSIEGYRNVLRAKIRANRSRSLVTDVVEVIQIATVSDDVVRVRDVGNATLLVMPTYETDADEIEALAFLLPRTRAAGVQMHAMFAPESVSGTYDFDSTGILLSDATTPGTPAPGLFDVRIL